ncbi:MAG: hypothetical protein QHC65_04150 [Sphingomonas sp.]|nr:hypothetical protein [Sphingomonas sp.]MDX3883590.1 hypothetical protein [Sphingomonas sp.]
MTGAAERRALFAGAMAVWRDEAGLSLRQAGNRMAVGWAFLRDVEERRIDPLDVPCALQGRIEQATGLPPAALGFCGPEDDGNGTPAPPPVIRTVAGRAAAGEGPAAGGAVSGVGTAPLIGDDADSAFFATRPWDVRLSACPDLPGEYELAVRVMRDRVALSIEAARALVADLNRHIELAEARQ